MRQETELDENNAGYADPMRGAITFENVSFNYDGVTKVSDDASAQGDDATGQAFALADVTLRIADGQTVAIVGQTGSGKTTLTRLVNRTYDATSGHVLVDGVDVRDWSLDALRGQIGAIEQDIFLFSRSVADNIAFGLGAGVTREAIEHAAKQAQAHEFIMSFADGYDTVVGERGVTLSGGQRQRLAIARALLTNPRILILDDATSAIDSATEDEIQRALREVMAGRTTLLITHRLSQIRQADQVVLMRRGRVVAVGSHEELMANSDLYRRIFLRYDGYRAPAPTLANA
jgi:ATP-binding cassette subfamily B protein